MNPKFAPSEEAVTAVTETVEEWKKELSLNIDLQEPTYVLACRVSSWIDHRSVQAGVNDVLISYLNFELKNNLTLSESIGVLSDRLAKRLLDDNLFSASRRSRSTVAG